MRESCTCFFFSSRRRHTRFDCDWSSDVCSSDLHALAGESVLPPGLVLTYLLHSFAELCLSPVGLSYMTKLAPPRFVGQVMGVWFLSLALGSNLAGQLTGQYDATHLESLPALFLKIFWYGVIGGAVMLLLTPFVKRMMAGVR